MKQLIEKEKEQELEKEKIEKSNKTSQEEKVGYLVKVVLTKFKQAPVVRRKVPEDEMPQITSFAPSYLIITNLRDKPANITIS